MTRKTAEERFWEKVDKQGPNDCWLWLGGIDRYGLGEFSVKHKTTRTHRYSWELHNGLIAKGMKLCHTCDNKHCVNPSHMQLKPISPPMEERFWEKVDKRGPDDCWLWTGTKLPFGYGNMKITKSREQVYVHRYSWELHNGPIPEGMLVCHHCDVPSCVNPSHLFLGSQTDNMQDCKNKRRNNYGDKHWNSKLRECDVLYIRKLWKWTKGKPKGGQRLVNELVKLFEVDEWTIMDVINNKTWTHLKAID